MNIVKNYYAKKYTQDKIDYINNHPDAYEEFAIEHPDLYITVKPKKYTLLDEKGRVLESYEYADGIYKDTTLVEVAKQELEKAEADYHRQLRRELMEKQKAAKEEQDA